ncbi:MAG: class I SAM-dependent methyltransferase, partial [Nanoarchaeota archaeon]
MDIENYKLLNERILYNWYNVSRRILIKRLIKRLKIKFENPLDVGCGVGPNSFLLKELSKKDKIVGIDSVDEAVKICKKKGIECYKADIEKKETLPKGKFDFILASDILEHTENDDNAVKNLVNLLDKKGYLFIVVPVFNFLWGDIDYSSHHKRRYTKVSIKKVLEKNNLKIRYENYCNFFAFLPNIFLTFFQRLTYKQGNKVTIGTGPKNLNGLLLLIAKVEIILMRFIKYPFGV